ncbi:hypothetical protein CDL12_05248 [Handroanthus impetiginosus]|uniref:Uncharacterized protein n=1 Tax=Handroanthus impetiginosus TaxID=429701 RepID=A0A2G9HX08_9LAMI|nr:hypothetical protein CDL12_05248 [Handroanthus impetiginosus]
MILIHSNHKISITVHRYKQEHNQIQTRPVYPNPPPEIAKTNAWSKSIDLDVFCLFQETTRKLLHILYMILPNLINRFSMFHFSLWLNLQGLSGSAGCGGCSRGEVEDWLENEVEAEKASGGEREKDQSVK